MSSTVHDRTEKAKGESMAFTHLTGQKGISGEDHFTSARDALINVFFCCLYVSKNMLPLIAIAKNQRSRPRYKWMHANQEMLISE